MGTRNARAARRARRAVGDNGGEAGAALVEFALLLPFLAILVFGTIDLGRAYSLKNSVTNMAREGAFVALSRPCPTGAAVGAALAEDPALASKVTVRVVQGQTASAPNLTCPGSNVLPAGTPVAVVASTQMSLITPLVAAVVGDPVTITGTVSVKSPNLTTTTVTP